MGTKNKDDTDAQQLSRPAHLISPSIIANELNTDLDNGITEEEAVKRLEFYGQNQLEGGDGVSAIAILVRQLFNAMCLILVMAMVVSFAIKSWTEGVVVFLVLMLNVIVGFIQEYNAEKTMDSLRSMASPTGRVIRAGHSHVVPSLTIVPGDMLELRVGDTVPADVRLIECMNFETDEALLTGESLPVQKDVNVTFSSEKESMEEISIPVGDRLNMAYSSSTVTKGRARGIVTGTGMSTEIGSIAKSLSSSGTGRVLKRNSDGKVTIQQYVRFGALRTWDKFGKFLGINVGTPLQRKLSLLAILLFGVAVVFAIIVMAANKFSSAQPVILYAVGTGLSMIPASLVVVLTITMAVGTKVMVKRNVIVRKLDSLEALGGVTNICSDKTGTLTQGKMIVRKSWIIGYGVVSIGSTSETFNPTVGDVWLVKGSPEDIAPGAVGEKIEATKALIDNPSAHSYFNVASMANVAVVSQNKEGNWEARGDPTEIAIQVFVSRFGWGRPHLMKDHDWKQLAEYPFDSTVKRMSVIFTKGHGVHDTYAFMKGAVERVLDACVKIKAEDGSGREEELTEAKKDWVIRNMDNLASQGLRVLALAYRPYDLESATGRLHRLASGYNEKVDDDAMLEPRDLNNLPRESVERQMTFLGIFGIYDPPRVETAGAVKACHVAGITVHMVTGDHPQTAAAIAKEVGIIPRNLDVDFSADTSGSLVVTATQFDKLTDDEIDELPYLPLVIARCAPQTKVRMVDALHRRGMFVAMTGDGVNDSPALKRSDVGIGMGLSGSDVAKSASDIVLTDDNFASILNAVEEGRRMFDNIKKFVLHLLAQNVAQAFLLLLGLMFKDQDNVSVFPLAPVQILWIIMVTSSFPAMGLGMEKAAHDIMDRPPHNVKTGVFTWEVVTDTLLYGIWTAANCIGAFALVVYGWGNGDLGDDCNDRYSERCDTVFRARSTAFICLVWFSLFLAWEVIDLRRSFFRRNAKDPRVWTQWFHDVWRNKFLFWSVVIGWLATFPIIYIPVVNHRLFKHAAISWEWAIVAVSTVLWFSGTELYKLAKRAYFRRYKETDGVVEGDKSLKLFMKYTTPVTTMETDRMKFV